MTAPPEPDSRAAWLRLAAIMALSTMGGASMWTVVVALPAVQAEFGAGRAAAAAPYTLTMAALGVGGILMGRLADRFGILRPLLLGIVALSLGYVAAGLAPSLTVFALAQCLLIGFLGGSVSFGPLLADTALWFRRRRGIAVALAASGNYLAGTVWPPVLTALMDAFGWRMAHVILGGLCLCIMLPLTLMMRAPAPGTRGGAKLAAGGQDRPLGLSPGTLTLALSIAGVACCVAMAMPQVHIVAYCGDLGYGVARGAEMLSLMLGCGIISRIASGFIADRIGGLRTLLLGTLLQGASLSLFLFFDGLVTLYLLSALFGLVQGGITPSYAVIVREYFRTGEVGMRVGIVLFATLTGMALGGWLAGLIFDLTGSYTVAFLNAVGWSALNIVIIATLILRDRGARPGAAPVSPARA